MATTKIMPLHIGKGRTIGKAISDIIDYVENPQKTDNGKLITGYACDSRSADAEFLFAKRQYISNTGRVRGEDDVIAYHLRQSFVPGEITPEEANRIGCELAKRFTKENHAYVVCTHIDKEHIHNHIIWNSVNLDCDRKFRNFWGSTRAVRRLNDTICIENGYSIVENPEAHGESYNKWLGDQAKPSHRELLCVAIDNVLLKKPAGLEELFTLLQKEGKEVTTGKTIKLKAAGWKRPARLDTLGEEYSEYALNEVILGKKEHQSCRNNVLLAEEKKVNLLVDIQAKVQAGKGAGYERWAKVFNLKQMAQTMNYLTEHGLLEYAVLAEKSEAATNRYNELSAQIKAAETRMAEIAALRTQIVNYAKTREIYTKQEVKLKTPSSERDLPIPDYVFEAILEQRKIYERNKSRRNSQFQDSGYICCSSYGKPRSKDFHWKYYKQLKTENNLPDIRWHDLRSTFSTLLLKNDFNPKAIAKLMGHAKELITMDVYGDKREIIADCVDELQPFIDEVMPDSDEDEMIATENLDVMILAEDYLI